MFRTRKLKQTKIVSEDDFVTFEHRKMTEFHPHCFVPQLALAEARQFDESVALARHRPAYGEDE
jgi:hypothetical protein